MPQTTPQKTRGFLKMTNENIEPNENINNLLALAGITSGFIKFKKCYKKDVLKQLEPKKNNIMNVTRLKIKEGCIILINFRKTKEAYYFLNDAYGLQLYNILHKWSLENV